MAQEPYQEPSFQDEDNQPCYVISVAARMVGTHAQTLRHYERQGLVEPARSSGNIRLYSRRDVQRVQRIKSLMEDLGVNLAGVEVIMRMSLRMSEMEQQMQRLLAELEERRAGPTRKQAEEG